MPLSSGDKSALRCFSPQLDLNISTSRNRGHNIQSRLDPYHLAALIIGKCLKVDSASLIRQFRGLESFIKELLPSNFAVGRRFAHDIQIIASLSQNASPSFTMPACQVRCDSNDPVTNEEAYADISGLGVGPCDIVVIGHLC